VTAVACNLQGSKDFSAARYGLKRMLAPSRHASTKCFAVCKMQIAVSEPAGAMPDTVDLVTELAIAADSVHFGQWQQI